MFSHQRGPSELSSDMQIPITDEYRKMQDTMDALEKNAS